MDYPAFPRPFSSHSGEHSLDFDESPTQEGMSLREYAAIHLRFPDSGNEELDAMIKKSLAQKSFIIRREESGEYIVNKPEAELK